MTSTNDNDMQMLPPGKSARTDGAWVQQLPRRRGRFASHTAQQARFRQQSSGTPTVSVIIPTLNEAENLPAVIARVPDWVDEIIIVDGHSPDDTGEVAKASGSNVTVMFQTGRGKGDAMLAGINGATSDIVILLDADGSTDPGEIPRFVAALRTGADFAKGTRFVAGGGSGDLTRLRRFGNRMLVHVVNRMWRTNFTDLCYGYNAFWRSCIPQLSLDASGFEIETLLALRVLRANVRIIEVPSYETPRLHGTTKLKTFRDGSRVLRTILAERIRPT